MMKKTFCILLINVLLLCSIAPLYAAKLDGVVIEGWSLEKIVAGQKVYSIQADRASFGTKRVGFFNLGFVKVVNLENVYLITFDKGNIVKNQHFNRAVYVLNSRCLIDEEGNVVFSE